MNHALLLIRTKPQCIGAHEPQTYDEQLEPDSVERLDGLALLWAEALLKAGQFARALEVLDDADGGGGGDQSASPYHQSGRGAAVECLRARALGALGRYTTATEHVSRAEKCDAASVDVPFVRGVVNMLQVIKSLQAEAAGAGADGVSAADGASKMALQRRSARQSFLGANPLLKSGRQSRGKHGGKKHGGSRGKHGKHNRKSSISGAAASGMLNIGMTTPVVDSLTAAIEKDPTFVDALSLRAEVSRLARKSDAFIVNHPRWRCCHRYLLQILPDA